MNYRHAFHAGNHADCLKHWALALCLARLAQKPARFAVLDTHAGVGRYDLAGEEATRSPEWRQGVARLLDWPDAPAQLAPYLDLVRADGARLYSGSPAIALAMMRADDRLIACELHDADVVRLRSTIGRDPRAHVHHRDGWEALPALTPFPERRGLVLIDPPYEDRGADLARSVRALKAGVGRFRNAVWLWWRPIIAPGECDRADAELSDLGLERLRADLDVDAPKGLSASSVLILNPPYGVESDLAAAGERLAERLAQGPNAAFRVR